MVNFSLEGKIALVTGASYGIGFALASAFAEAGAKIVFNDINQDFVDKGLAAYKEKGIDAHGYVCDVTNEEQVNAMVDRFIEAGFNYFDTAHGYIDGKSEIAIGECLAARYDRESYILANKLSDWFFNTEEEVRPFFEEQLRICGV